MKFIQGKDRNQTEFFCLDQPISDDNEVRLIDLFVNAIKLSDYGFKLDVYRKRQAIVEHLFGIIKRQWDFYYIMTKKTLKHASADVGLIFTCYNLRRFKNLIDQKILKKFLREFAVVFLVLRSYFKAIYGNIIKKNHLSTFCETVFLHS